MICPWYPHVSWWNPMVFAGESLVFKVLQDNNGKAPGRLGMGEGCGARVFFPPGRKGGKHTSSTINNKNSVFEMFWDGFWMFLDVLRFADVFNNKQHGVSYDSMRRIWGKNTIYGSPRNKNMLWTSHHRDGTRTSEALRRTNGWGWPRFMGRPNRPTWAWA